MEKTYTINQDQLTRVLENLSNIRKIMDYEEKYGTPEEHEKYLEEFCGIIGVLCDLGLIREWDKFRAAEIRAEMKKEDKHD